MYHEKNLLAGKGKVETAALKYDVNPCLPSATHAHSLSSCDGSALSECSCLASKRNPKSSYSREF